MYDPAALGAAIGALLVMPEPVDIAPHVGSRVTVAERLAHLRILLRRGSFSFDEAVAQADRVTVAVTLFARARAVQAGRADLDARTSRSARSRVEPRAAGGARERLTA